MQLTAKLVQVHRGLTLSCPESGPGAFDGQLFFIEQPFDLQEQLKIAFTVGTLVGVGPCRSDLGELALPITEYVGFDSHYPAHLPDPEVFFVVRNR